MTELLDISDRLALAVIAASDAPLVLLDGDLAVVAASDSFCAAFGLDPADVAAVPLSALGGGEWDIPQVESLLCNTLAGHAEIQGYEIDLDRPGTGTRRLVLHARKLDYGTGDARLLLTITDVTDARIAAKAKDDALAERTVLLRELQHRVANSLQIIASVLMQSARKVQSAETRAHLHDAHNRVMSVAAVQRQLTLSQVGDVVLRTYFTELCKSIAASMIHDHDQLSLDVQADDTAVGPEVAVSLGLIVTELTINALKHAFPKHRHGTITVAYQATGPSWRLSIRDDGVGMAVDPDHAKPGLGTGIVEALAKQLDAEVVLTRTNPGTEVAIVHR